MQIEVNGVPVTDQEIDRETQYHPSSTLEEARQQAACALVVRSMLLQEAERLGIVAADTAGVSETAEEATIRVLIERSIDIPQADEQTCRRYFASHADRFRSPDLFEVSHILIAAAPDDSRARTLAGERAQAALRLLDGCLDRFADLAARMSDCPSKHAGGYLGQISRGQTVPEFESALRRLTPGELSSRPIESRYGFHVTCLHRRIEGVSLEFEQVRDRIANYLNESVRRRAINQYLRILAGKAKITGIELRGAASPLLQ